MPFEFNKKKNIVYAYKNKCAIPDLKDAFQLNSSVYENAQKYYNDPKYLRTDIVERWFPAFQRMLGVTDEQLSIADIIIRQQDPMKPFQSKAIATNYYDSIDYSTESHNRGSKVDHYTKYEVLMKFNIKGFTKTEYVPVMCIPWVREDGIIEYNGKEYAFIHMLEQTDGISFNPNLTNNNPAEINIRTNRNNIKIFKNKAGDVLLELGKTQKYEMISIVSSMLRKESGLLGEELNVVWDDFADNDIINNYDTSSSKFMERWYYSKTSSRGCNVSDITEKVSPVLMGLPIDGATYTNTKYSTINLREELNDVLSLRQALNKELAKPVYGDDGQLVAKEGIIVTESVIDKLNRAGVWKVYVKNNENIVNAILAEDIIMSVIPKGTLTTNEIEDAFPEETGMYTVKDHYYSDNKGRGIDDVFIISKDTYLTQSDINRIIDTGRDSISIKNGNKIRKINFFTEIITNRQFKGDWIGKEAGKWYYKTMEGDYVIPVNIGYTAYDMVAMWSYAIKALRGTPTIKLPNIDEDFRKSLIPINEQFRRAMSYAISNGMAQMKQTFASYWKGPDKVLFTMADSILIEKFYAYERLFWKYLTNEAKCVRMVPSSALNNPIAYISEVTKANVYTASKNSVSDTQRRISIGSYGKLDPYEIPQSGKIGVVNNMSTYVKVEENGKIKTPYYRVKHTGSKSVIDLSNIHYMSVEQEEKHIIADICSMTVDDNGNILDSDDSLVLCIVPDNNFKDRQSFDKRKISEVEFVNINAMQPLSWAASTVPFLCNNDAARAVFAVAQMKQAKGMVYPQEPIVMTTSYEMIPRLNNKFGFISKQDEWLYTSSRNKYTGNWVIETANTPFGVKGINNEIVEYPEFRQGDNSVMTIHQEILVNENLVTEVPTLKEGDIVLSTNFVSPKGIMQFGRNAFTLFIPDGFNYEDSAHISDEFAKNMQSYRVNEELLPCKPSRNMPRIKNTPDHPIQTSVEFMPGTDNDTVTIAYKDRTKGTARYDRKIKHAYGNYIGEYAHQTYDGVYDGVVIQLLSKDYPAVGDKFSNRHGNKCTVCKIGNDDMPIINNGWMADVVLNPLGVGSRMNIGQIKELHLGLVGQVLGLQFSTDAYNCITKKEIAMWLEFAWSCANETTHYSKLREDEAYPGDLDKVMERPQFNSIPENVKDHVRRNFDKVQMWANTFNKKGEFDYYYLKETEETDDSGNKVIIKVPSRSKAVGGFLYMFKLTQESYKKAHARANEMSDEEYSKLTDAPTRGASRGGGQRLGTMEIDALCAYDASSYIHEALNERSDNAIARENFNLSTYFDPRIAKPYMKDSKGQRRSVTEFMYTLLALGIMPSSTDGEIIPMSYSNSEDLKHVKGQFIQRELGKQKRASQSDEESKEAEETASKGEPIDKELAHRILSKISFTD